MGKRILLIDNDEDEHAIFSFAIASIQRDYALHAACTPAQAVDCIKQAWPDIIFLDVHMPIDGFTCYKILKKEFPGLEEIPFYFYTSAPDKDVFNNARLLKAAGVVLKREGIKELSRSLKALIEY